MTEANGGSRNPLRESIAEQLTKMRGPERPPPDALLDVVVDSAEPCGGEPVSVLRPRDWDELRHQEGADGRTAPYWARMWPSGLALADAVAAGPELNEKRVIELGCGLGLPSIVAARRGARVLATDGSPDAVVFTAHNLAINDAVGDVVVADWRASAALLEGAPWDLVLAADVLYLRHNVDALLRLLPKLVADGGVVLLADPSRSGGRDFLAAARGLFSVDTQIDPVRPRVNVHTLRRTAAGG